MHEFKCIHFLTAYDIFTLFCSDGNCWGTIQTPVDKKFRPLAVDRLVKITGNNDTVVDLMTGECVVSDSDGSMCFPRSWLSESSGLVGRRVHHPTNYSSY